MKSEILKIKTQLEVQFEIIVSSGLLNPNNRSLIEIGDSNRRLVFVDSKVFGTYGEKIHLYFSENNIRAKIISIDISEEKKGLDTLMFMLNIIENFGLLRRSEPILAIGGGVLLDMIGLAANIFRRGVPYIKVPTTLLSLVDASVGVKTSINHFDRRNRLGSYYAPSAVYLDKTFLKSLPPDEIYSAMGEIIKMAVIKDANLFDLLESHASDVIEEKFIVDGVSDEIIYKSIDGMIAELEPNLWELDLKRIVDFGHSFSPLLEMKSLEDSNAMSLTHGQAVALDVIFSSCLGYQKGFLDENDLERIIKVCRSCKLPVYHQYFEDHLLLWNSLIDTSNHRNGDQNLPIPNGIGKSIFLNNITIDDIKKTISIYQNKVK